MTIPTRQPNPTHGDFCVCEKCFSMMMMMMRPALDDQEHGTSTNIPFFNDYLTENQARSGWTILQLIHLMDKKVPPEEWASSIPMFPDDKPQARVLRLLGEILKRLPEHSPPQERDVIDISQRKERESNENTKEDRPGSSDNREIGDR